MYDVMMGYKYYYYYYFRMHIMPPLPRHHQTPPKTCAYLAMCAVGLLALRYLYFLLLLFCHYLLFQIYF